MKCSRSMVILIGVSLVVGCATQAPATSTGASADHAGAMAAPAAVPPQTASATPQGATAQSNEVGDGYDRVIVHGQELFCRREATPGTRVTAKVCRTKAEIEAAQEAAKQYIDSAQRNAGATGNGQPAGPY